MVLKEDGPRGCGGFRRGRDGLYQGPGAGREGLMNSAPGRWVWQEDKREEAMRVEGSRTKVCTIQ
jgi:hypothetical protein